MGTQSGGFIFWWTRPLGNDRKDTDTSAALHPSSSALKTEVFLESIQNCSTTKSLSFLLKKIYFHKVTQEVGCPFNLIFPTYFSEYLMDYDCTQSYGNVPLIFPVFYKHCTLCTLIRRILRIFWIFYNRLQYLHNPAMESHQFTLQVEFFYNKCNKWFQESSAVPTFLPFVFTGIS